jgi:LysM repeat protein
MVKSPKIRYSLVLFALVILLTGCELRRDDSEYSDPGPVSDLPPTLAPLGSGTDAVSTAITPIPTITNVQSESASTVAVEGQSDEVAVITVQESNTIVSDESVEGASSISSDSDELIAPQAESAVAAEGASEEAIIVNATTSDDLPLGGPVAANPPASQTTSNYANSVDVGTGYTVQSGDTLYSIAVRYNTSISALMAANGLATDVIYAGQSLTISSNNSYDTTPSYQDQTAAYDSNFGNGQHLVSPGDTLFSLALRYNTSVEAIAAANSIAYPYYIQSGQTLAIPTNGDYAVPSATVYEEPVYQNYPTQPNDYVVDSVNPGTHTVSPGETLFSIAQFYGTTPDILSTANGLYNPNEIYVGQVLYLP